MGQVSLSTSRQAGRPCKKDISQTEKHVSVE